MHGWEGELSSLYRQYVHADASFYAFCSAELVRRIVLPPGARVLDLAGGAGITSRLILERAPDAHITILDASADQLDHARAIFGENAQYVLNRAEQYEPTEQFDVLVCANAFWYLHPSIIARLANWLAPGGILAFNLHEANTHFRDRSFFAAVHVMIDKLARENHRTACLIYSAVTDVDKLSRSLADAGFTIHRDAIAQSEAKENWKVLCELEARRTAPMMAITIDPEAKLALYRQAFRTVAKERGGIERHSLLFLCTKRA